MECGPGRDTSRKPCVATTAHTPLKHTLAPFATGEPDLRGGRDQGRLTPARRRDGLKKIEK